MGRENYRKIASVPENQKWLKKRLDVEVPGRCDMHQCVKAAYDEAFYPRRCICCAHYHKDVTSETCFACLATEHLDNFKTDPLLESESWYLYMVEEAKRKAGAL